MDYNIKMFYKQIFYIMMLVFIITAVAYGIMVEEHPYLTILFYNQSDSFSDFYSSLRDAHGFRPYDFGCIYPALAYIFYGFFQLFVPEEIMSYVEQTGEYMCIRNYQMGGMIFIYYSLFVFSIFGWILYHFKKGKKIEKLLFVFILFFSVPVIFAIERGNLIMMVIPLVTVFFCWKESEIKWKKEISFLCLAIAASLKIYPALFGIVLLFDKKWKDAIRCAIYGIGTFIIPFFFVGGLGKISVMISNILGTNSVFLEQSGLGYKVNLLNTLTFLSSKYSVLSNFVIQKFFIIGMILIVFFAQIYIDVKWKKYLAISLFIILLPGFSFVYNIMYLIPVVMLFLNSDNDDIKYLDIVYLLLFVIILSPILIKLIGRFECNGGVWGYTFSTFLESMALCGLLLIIGVEVIINILIKVRVRLNNGKDIK